MVERSQASSRTEHRRFDAFISYSHGADAPIAAALETAIKRFARPFSIFNRQPISIFRDQTNLSASPHLWDDIAASLEAADHLILVASPRASASKWVQKELCAWLSRGRCSNPSEFSPAAVDAERRGRLLFAVTDGDVVWDEASGDFSWERTSALPRMLSKVFPGEPHWVDLRWARGAAAPLDRTNPEFMTAAARLAARVRNLPLERLIGLDQREQQRRLRVIAGTAIVLTGLAIAACGFAVFYFRTSNTLAAANRDLEIRQAQMLVSQGTMVGDLPPTQPLPASDRGIIERTIQGLGARAPEDGTLDYARTGMLFYARALETYARLGMEAPETIETLARFRWRLPRIQAAWPQPHEIADIAVSPDGTLVAIASGDEARVLDRRSGRLTRAWQHPTDVSIVRFSPDGRWLATGSGDRFLRVWDVREGLQIVKLELPVREGDEQAEDERDYGDLVFSESDHSVALVEFSADGRFLAAAHGNLTVTATHRVHIWDCATRRSLDPIELTALPTVVAFSPKGTSFAIGTHDGEVLLFRSGAFRPIAAWKPASDPKVSHVTALVFTRDESLLAAGGGASVVRVIRTTPAAIWYELRVADAVTSIAFRPDASGIAVASEDRALREYRLGSTSASVIVLPGIPHRVEYSPRGTYLVAALDDGSVRAWGGIDGLEVLRARSSSGRFTFVPGVGLLVGDGEHRVVTLNPEEHGSTRTFAAPDRRSNRQRHFDPDAEALVEHDDEVVRWRSPDSGHEIANAPVASLSSGSGWSQQEGVFVAPASASLDGAGVVRLRNGRVERVALTPTPRGRPMAVDRRRSRVALPLNPASIGVWDTASGKLIGEYTFPRPRDESAFEPWALALNEDGTRLAMVNRTHQVWLWGVDGASPSAARALDGDNENLFTVAFAAGTGLLLAGDSFKTFVFDGTSGARRCEIPHRPHYEELSVSASGTDLVVLTGKEQAPLVATMHRLTMPGCPAGARFDLGVEEPVSVAMSRSGTVAAVSTGEKTPPKLHVLDFATMRRMVIPLSTDSKPHWAAFTRDDRFVVTANFSGFRFWPWRTSDILEDARARAAAAPF